ncbi:hypothetical protein ACQPZ8_19720 [Actinomadura nitritigenes]|uniref:hypothetical protein n=1 Tax=Actinomadura nitritigenes TaxID=134602 RepID=UPI003D93CE1A
MSATGAHPMKIAERLFLTTGTVRNTPAQRPPSWAPVTGSTRSASPPKPGGSDRNSTVSSNLPPGRRPARTEPPVRSAKFARAVPCSAPAPRTPSLAMCRTLSWSIAASAESTSAGG